MWGGGHHRDLQHISIQKHRTDDDWLREVTSERERLCDWRNFIKEANALIQESNMLIWESTMLIQEANMLIQEANMLI